MKKILTLLVEGNEEDLQQVKSEIIRDCAYYLTSYQETEIEEKAKDIEVFGFMENKENESVRV